MSYAPQISTILDNNLRHKNHYNLYHMTQNCKGVLSYIKRDSKGTKVLCFNSSHDTSSNASQIQNGASYRQFWRFSSATEQTNVLVSFPAHHIKNLNLRHTTNQCHPTSPGTLLASPLSVRHTVGKKHHVPKPGAQFSDVKTRQIQGKSVSHVDSSLFP